MAEQLNLIIDENKFSELTPLLQEAQEVFSATENSLEELKNKSWCKRLFEAITFQSGAQRVKVICENINSLMQLQNIVLKVTLIVAARVAEVASILNGHAQEISDLYDKQIALGKLTKAVAQKSKENYIKLAFGYTEKLKISDLESYKKEALLNTVCAVTQNENLTDTDESKEFITALMKLCNSHAHNTGYDFSKLNEFGKDEATLFYETILKFLYFTKQTFDMSMESDKILSYLAVGKSRISELMEEISSLVKFVNPEILIPSTDDFGDDSIVTVELDESAFELEKEQDKNQDLPKEEITQDKLPYVDSGEEEKVENKSITFMDFFNVKGNLTFENCDIYFDEKDFERSPIVLEKGAELKMDKCFVHCKISDEKSVLGQNSQQKYLIDSKENCSLVFENCTLKDCSFFCRLQGKNDLIVSVKFHGCKIIDCHKVLHLKGSSNSVCEFFKCEIENGKRLEFNNSENNNVVTCDCEVKMTNCKLRSNLFLNEQQAIIKTNVFFAHGGWLYAIDCNFHNALFDNYCSFSYIKNGKFFDCIGNIQIRGCVEDSHFENCKISSSLAHIKHTVFKNTSVNFGYNDIYDDKCIFSDYSEKNIDGKSTGALLKATGICGNIKLKFCIFENINMINSYLFDASSPIDDYAYYRKNAGNLTFDSCSFRNCSTYRDDRKLINTTGYHYDKIRMFVDDRKWRKKISYEAVTFKNCNGLNSVKKNNGIQAPVIDESILVKDNPVLIKFLETLTENSEVLEKIINANPKLKMLETPIMPLCDVIIAPPFLPKSSVPLPPVLLAEKGGWKVFQHLKSQRIVILFNDSLKLNSSEQDFLSVVSEMLSKEKE